MSNAESPETITPDQGKDLEALVRATKVKWGNVVEQFQIAGLGQLPKASSEEAQEWPAGQMEAVLKKSA